jgi:hypothetical protein
MSWDDTISEEEARELARAWDAGQPIPEDKIVCWPHNMICPQAVIPTLARPSHLAEASTAEPLPDERLAEIEGAPYLEPVIRSVLEADDWIKELQRSMVTRAEVRRWLEPSYIEIAERGGYDG